MNSSDFGKWQIIQFLSGCCTQQLLLYIYWKEQYTENKGACYR